MPGFLAYVIPVGDGGGGGQPPGIWPPPGGVYPPTFPTHPIAPGGPPPGIWPSPGHPAHPIAPGGQPPGIWGPGSGMPTPPIYVPIVPPSTGEGGEPSHPIYIPVYPSHLPTLPPAMAESIKQALKEFATGNLPPTAQPVQ